MELTTLSTDVIPTPIEDPCVIFGVKPIGASDGPLDPRAGEVIDTRGVRETVRVGVVGVPVHGELLLTGRVRDAPVDHVDTSRFVIAFFVARETPVRR
jgi:hypothetical protein